jgi:endonuclease/exonuclease/phosphatase (EEP) superfamily protein YafD
VVILRLLLGAAVFLGALATCAGALAPLFPPADTINHFRPYVFVGTGALLAITFVAHAPIAARLSTILAALNAVLLLLPFLWSAGNAGVQASASAIGHDLKIVSFNVAWTPRPIDNVARYLLSEDADIVVLQEVTQAHAATVEPLLRDRYPHSHLCVIAHRCAQAIFSKHPWASVVDVYRSEDTPEMIIARFGDAKRGAFRVYGLHMAWPFRPEAQARHVDRLMALGKSIDEPAILAGDFNLTPWSYQLQRLLASTGLRRHATFLMSWPTNGYFRLPVPLFLIDHVLSTPDVRTIAIKSGPDLGSDHLPIVARVLLGGKR